MTPLAVIWNVFLFIVWWLKLQSLNWVFSRANLTLLRYPEVQTYSLQLTQLSEKYLPRGIYINKHLPFKVNSKISIVPSIKTTDPLIPGLIDRYQIRGINESENFISDIFKFIFYADDSESAILSVRTMLLLALDTYLILFLLGVDTLTIKTFMLAYALVFTSWLGVYRIISVLFLSDFVKNLVRTWFLERKFMKIKFLSIFLLPIATLESLMIMSALQFLSGNNWKLTADLYVRVPLHNQTSMDILIHKILYEFDMLPKFKNEFIPQLCEEFKKAILLVLNTGNKTEIDNLIQNLPNRIKSYIESYVDPESLKFSYAMSKIESLLRKII